MRTLPRWREEWSDGCSCAPLFSAVPEWRAACVKHDEAYYFGGSPTDRAMADDALYADWIAAGMPEPLAKQALEMVRRFGSPEFKRPGISWAFGGEFFAYSDHPAVPE